RIETTCDTDGSKTLWNSAGNIRPKSDGPSTSPAAISPHTRGCPIRRNSPPKTRDEATITISCRTTISRMFSLWPLVVDIVVDPCLTESQVDFHRIQIPFSTCDV